MKKLLLNFVFLLSLVYVLVSCEAKMKEVTALPVNKEKFPIPFNKWVCDSVEVMVPTDFKPVKNKRYFVFSIENQEGVTSFPYTTGNHWYVVEDHLKGGYYNYDLGLLKLDEYTEKDSVYSTPIGSTKINVKYKFRKVTFK